jgi:hypothetical protein
MNNTRIPKEDQLLDWGRYDNQVKNGDRVENSEVDVRDNLK